MEFIQVSMQNIENEHICCAIGNAKDIKVKTKKSWLCERFKDGLVFLKGDVRGKCFIEYIPAEKAFAPIEAPGYMYIDCFWVSGQFKEKGNGKLLLSACIEDCRKSGKKGICVISSASKRPFLSDGGFLKYMGFSLCDTNGFFELLYLPLEVSAEKPAFKKIPKAEDEGFVLYYTNACPFCAQYVPLAEEIFKSEGVKLKTVLLDSCEMAQNSPAVFTTYSLFYGGELIAAEILSEKKLLKIIGEHK